MDDLRVFLAKPLNNGRSLFAGAEPLPTAPKVAAGGRPLTRPGGDEPAIVVPEVRDYTRINAELVRLLDAGHRRVRLAGVDGQRLLVQGLRATGTRSSSSKGTPAPSSPPASTPPA